MREPKPYAIADRILRTLNRKALKRVENCKRRLLTVKFDELNVVQEVDALYGDMDADNRVAYKKLFKERFLEMLAYLSVRKPKDDEIDDLVEMYLAGILSEPNDVTHFAYDTEVYRKRDRAKEAVNAVPGRVEKQIELDKAIRLWSRQTTWYADIVSDEANLEALRKSGAKRVEWVTQEDDKVCAVCKERNGKIYPIDKLPPKSHLGCRCYVRRAD